MKNCLLVNAFKDGWKTNGYLWHHPSSALLCCCQHTHKHTHTTQFCQDWLYPQCLLLFLSVSFVVFLQLPQPPLLHIFIYKHYSFRNCDCLFVVYLPSCLIIQGLRGVLFVLSQAFFFFYYSTLKFQHSSVYIYIYVCVIVWTTSQYWYLFKFNYIKLSCFHFETDITEKFGLGLKLVSHICFLISRKAYQN